ncbi:hypothetical protein HY003_03840 [Candidatus Saccharibacteria bacterium]|nr:hypothetical protein [Candidatus Saccharibacteria bacterium]MBI3338404.1 hypothetical protein [Candidatus Saccharibacteria bacterium]
MVKCEIRVYWTCRKIVRSQSELSRAKTVLSEGEVALATLREEKPFVFDSEVSPQAQTRRVADRIRSGDGGVCVNPVY